MVKVEGTLEELKALFVESAKQEARATAKRAGKATVKKAVHGYWTELLSREAEEKSTLRYLNLEECSTKRIHPVWSHLSSPLDVQQATVKKIRFAKLEALT